VGIAQRFLVCSIGLGLASDSTTYYPLTIHLLNLSGLGFLLIGGASRELTEMMSSEPSTRQCLVVLQQMGATITVIIIINVTILLLIELDQNGL